jgi:hypothetical protein
MSDRSTANTGKKPEREKDAKSIRGKVQRADLKRFTPKQRKFILLMPKVATGDLTVEAALKQAGYADSTARQQKSVTGRVRHVSAMQEALRKAGVDEKLVASKVKTGIGSWDKDTMFKFAKLAAELLDAFPAQKQDHTFRTEDEVLDDVEKDGETAAWEVPEEK